MGKRIDLTGKTFGRLFVIGDSGDKYGDEILWTCRCECGNWVKVRGKNLRYGDSQSCGCLQRELASKNRTKQGRSGIQGVTFHKQKNKWAAYINYEGKQYHLLISEEMEECVKVRREAERMVEEGCFLEWYNGRRNKKDK